MYYATELLNTALTLKGSGYHNITARVGLENEMYEQKCLAIFISFKSAMEIPLLHSHPIWGFSSRPVARI